MEKKKMEKKKKKKKKKADYRMWSKGQAGNVK